MHSRRTGRSHDQIIREALQRELESVPSPPAEPLWTRIRAALAREEKKRAAFSWRRLSAAAALILLFAGAGLALSRSGLLESSRPLYEDGVEMDCSEGRVAGTPSGAEGAEATRPSTLPGGFTLDQGETREFSQAGKNDWTVSVYRRGEEKLIWICSSPSPDLREFVGRIGRELEVRVEIIEDTSVVVSREGVLEFTAGGRPGIAWVNGAGYQALLALSGTPDLHALLSGLLFND